jgi:hypothetical protein
MNHIISAAVLIAMITVGMHSSNAADQKPDTVVLVPGIIFGADEPAAVSEAHSLYWSKISEAIYKHQRGSHYYVRFAGNQLSVDTIRQGDGPAVYIVCFSYEAALDSLVYRAIELDLALQEICRRESSNITLIGHSAGGLVARLVLQEAIPKVTRPPCVKRLITICSPHQGCRLADSSVGLKGTRGTSLQTNAPVIMHLNSLRWPSDVQLTGIVVSSFGAESLRPGRSFVIPPSFLGEFDCPKAFSHGGDCVVHNISQNIAFTDSGSSAISAGQLMVLLIRSKRLPIGNKKVHTEILSSPEFCNSLCTTLFAPMPENMDRLQAIALVQCHLENEILEAGLPLFPREVCNVEVTDLTFSETSITYKAKATWRLTTEYNENFEGSLLFIRHPVLGLVEK